MKRFEMKHCYVRVAVIALILSAVVSCGGKPNPVDVVKKGHFDGVPNTTLEELVSRYQYTDPKTVKWELVTDANKNELVKVCARFDEQVLPVFASVQELIDSGQRHYTVLDATKDDFFKEICTRLLRKETGVEFKSSDKTPLRGADVTVMDIEESYFEPQYTPGTDDVSLNTYFTCTGGELALLFTVEGERFSVKNYTLTFNMTSTIEELASERYVGADVNYDLIVTEENDLNVIKKMLVDNTDFLRSSGIDLDL
ncbi:hypothetical protein FACS1894200_05560 [Spirochaetia bacterium]|nr:hypothetical protein FACS1894200_05560 [Spirochaetia bacterium]